jgi:hypothetical protein
MKINLSILILVFIFSFGAIVGRSQSKCWDSGMERDPGMRLIARGKIFGFVIIEDVFVATGTLGLEYKFAKRHSIGSDIIWTKHWYENDSTNQVTGEDYGSGFWQDDTRLNFMVDYRFYFSIRNEKCKYRGLYLSTFHRRGTMKWRSCDDYVFRSGEYIRKDAIVRDLGLAIGLRLGGDRCDRWGFDTSFGIAHRNKVEDYQKYESSTEVEYVTDEKSISWIPVIRFNLTYSFIIPRYLRVSEESTIPK